MTSLSSHTWAFILWSRVHCHISSRNVSLKPGLVVQYLYSQLVRMWGSCEFEARPGIVIDTLIPKIQKRGGMALVIDCLPTGYNPGGRILFCGFSSPVSCAPVLFSQKKQNTQGLGTSHKMGTKIMEPQNPIHKHMECSFKVDAQERNTRISLKEEGLGHVECSLLPPFHA